MYKNQYNKTPHNEVKRFEILGTVREQVVVDGKSTCVNCGTAIKMKPISWKKLKDFACCSRSCRGEMLKNYYSGNKNPRSKYKTPMAMFFAHKHNNIKSAAKKRGLSFSLGEGFLLKLFNDQNGLCFYTGIPMKLSSSGGIFSGKDQPDLDILSVDRVDSSRGYEEDNVVLCCNAINKLKGNVEVEGLKKFLEFLTVQKTNCTLSVAKLHDDARLPRKNSLGDAGYDLFVHRVEEDEHHVRVYSGVAIQPSLGWFIEMFPRSSIYKRNLMLANSVGVCDTLYSGEYMGVFLKTSAYIHDRDAFKPGERFAQLVVRKHELVSIKEVPLDHLNSDVRGPNGYGSSGK